MATCFMLSYWIFFLGIFLDSCTGDDSENGFQALDSFAASAIGGLIIGKAICSAVGNAPEFSFVDYISPAIFVFFYFLMVFALLCPYKIRRPAL